MLSLVIIALLLLEGVFINALVDAGFLARRLGNSYQIKEYNRWYVYLLFIVVAISYPTNLASSIRDDMLQASKIPSQSMSPGILPSDRVLLNKARYKIAPVQRGDVVVFVYPDDRRIYYLKRIVALPGVSVEIHDIVVYVNDRPLVQHPVETRPGLNFTLPAQVRVVVEDNGDQRYPVIIDPTRPVSMARLMVPHGQRFVLADDDIRHLGDSRTFGPVPLAGPELGALRSIPKLMDIDTRLTQLSGSKFGIQEPLPVPPFGRLAINHQADNAGQAIGEVQENRYDNQGNGQFPREGI